MKSSGSRSSHSASERDINSPIYGQCIIEALESITLHEITTTEGEHHTNSISSAIFGHTYDTEKPFRTKLHSEFIVPILGEEAVNV